MKGPADSAQAKDPEGRSGEAGRESLVLAIGRDEAGLRLDRALAGRLSGQGLSREKIKKLIGGGRVTLNGRPELSPKTPLREGDRLEISLPEKATRLAPEQGELKVLYRDAALAVLDKAAGLVVHPAPGRPGGTLAHRLLARFPELARQEGFRPGIVHRLDKDTSGLLIAALSEKCRLALAAMFARREIRKEYLALVHGVPSWRERVIEAPVGRHPRKKTMMCVSPHGKEAKSAARLLHADPLGRFSLLAVRIFSGRTHQVRVHMQHLGHPLWGDALYKAAPGAGKAPQAWGDGEPRRQMLHAWKLSFRHPLPEEAGKAFAEEAADGCLSFLCPPPADFAAAARHLSRHSLHAILTGAPGCGKSTLLDALRRSGLPVFSADEEVAALYAPGGDARRLLRLHFGERFVPDDKGPVDKAALGAAMRADAALRREVEALVHPLVWHALRRFHEGQEQSGAPLTAAEIPLYLESGRPRQEKAPPGHAPLLVGVRCPFAVREKRLKARGWSAERIAEVESWQWPEEKKMRACDLVLDNSGARAAFAAEAALLPGRLEALRQKREDALAEKLAALWNGG